jgi:hypothetical protein
MWLVCAIAFAGLDVAAAEGVSLTDARTALEQWVETEQLVSKTRSDWQTDKEMLEQTIQLYERELQAVEEKLSTVSTNSTQVDKEREQAEAQLKSSQESLDRSRDFAAGFEGKVAQLVPRLPVPLQEILKPLLARLPADPANTKMAATERVQVLVGILNELDKFNNAVNIFSEKRKNDRGEEVAVETVYVGLGAAYFVNDADNFAGMGTPGPTGWEWTIKPELASSVREVVRIYRNERGARFIALPATIQ